MENRIKAYIYLFFVIIFWGSFPATAKLLLKRLDVFQVLFYNFLFAVLALALILASQGKFTLLRKYPKRGIFIMLAMGLIGPFLHNVCHLKSYAFVPVNEAIILNYLWPVTIVILSVFILREKVSFKGLFGITLAFIGCYLLISKGQWISPTFSSVGYLFAIGAAFFWALFSVLGKKVNYEAYTSMFAYLTIAFLFTSAAVAYFSSFVLPTLPELAGLAYLGIFTTGIAYVFWFKALKLGETAKISTLVYLVPFVSLVFIHFLLGEKILLTSFIGLLLIICGALIQIRRKVK